jgi:hypothetical protein
MNENQNWFEKVLSLEPALLRALLVALAAILAQVLNHTVITDGDVNDWVDFFTAAAAILAGFFIRPSVTPNTKVLSYLPDPVNSDAVLPGEGARAE